MRERERDERALPCQGGTAIALVVATVPRHPPAVRHVLVDAVAVGRQPCNCKRAVCNCPQRTPAAGPAKQLMHKRTKQVLLHMTRRNQMTTYT